MVFHILVIISLSHGRSIELWGSSVFLGYIYPSPIPILFCKLAPICFYLLEAIMLTNTSIFFVHLNSSQESLLTPSCVLACLWIYGYNACRAKQTEKLSSALSFFIYPLKFYSFVISIKCFPHDIAPVSSVELIILSIIYLWTQYVPALWKLLHIVSCYSCLKAVPVWVSNSFKGSVIFSYSLYIPHVLNIYICT